MADIYVKCLLSIFLYIETRISIQNTILFAYKLHNSAYCVLIGTNYFLKTVYRKILWGRRKNNLTLPKFLVIPIHYTMVFEKGRRKNIDAKLWTKTLQ